MKLWGKIILGRRPDTHKDSEMGMYLAYDKGQVRIPKVGRGEAFSFYTKNNEKPLNGCERKEMFPGLYFRTRSMQAVGSHGFITHLFFHLFIQLMCIEHLLCTQLSTS